jgi:hypothetical protein
MSITKISPDVVDFDAGITISTTDNTSNLILTSTDADANIGPVLELYRNSSSPADNDELARIYFYGENDNDEKIEYALIKSNIVDASDGAEGSSLQIYTYSTGGQRNRIDLLEGETVFNEGSQDIDFRVESNDSINMLFVDGGNNKVLIEAQNTDTVSNAATMTAAAVLEINGNAGEGSDHIKIGAMADGTGNQFIEATNSGATAAYKLMINPVNGGNLYSGGNLEFPSGKGIDFSATGDATGMSSELLDDYEEGNYNPTVTADSGSFGLASGSDEFSYIKIGALVHVQGYISISSDSSASGNIKVSLPYNSYNASDDPDYSFGTVLVQNGGTTLTQKLYPFIQGNIDSFYIYMVNDDGTTDYLDETHVDTNWQLGVTLSYTVR